MEGSKRGLVSLLVSVGLLASTPALAAPEVQRPVAPADSNPADETGEARPAPDEAGEAGEGEAGEGEAGEGEAGEGEAGEGETVEGEAGEGETVEGEAGEAGEPGSELTPLPDVVPDEPKEQVDVVPAPVADEPVAEPEDDLDYDDDDESFDDDYDPFRDSPEALTARRWLGAGIGATLVGTALVSGAVAMGLGDPCAPSSGNNCFGDAADRAALSMGVPGGVLLLGGVAMIAVGVVQKQRLAASLSVSADQIGVVLVGRF